MLNLLDFITDRIIGIFLAVLGFIILFTPYDKFKEAHPKMPSKKMAKVLGAILAVGGILSAIAIL